MKSSVRVSDIFLVVHLNKSINYTIQSVTEVQQKVVMEVLHTTFVFPCCRIRFRHFLVFCFFVGRLTMELGIYNSSVLKYVYSFVKGQ